MILQLECKAKVYLAGCFGREVISNYTKSDLIYNLDLNIYCQNYCPE